MNYANYSATFCYFTPQLFVVLLRNFLLFDVLDVRDFRPNTRSFGHNPKWTVLFFAHLKKKQYLCSQIFINNNYLTYLMNKKNEKDFITFCCCASMRRNLCIRPRCKNQVRLPRRWSH